MRKMILLLLSAGVAFGAVQPTLSDKDLRAQMPSDVGPATVDVSQYPAVQQDNYKLFLERCSRCHTPARAINSRITSEKDWEHFVSLMHGRLLSRSTGEPWKGEEGRRIIDFLAYDSQVRKVEHTNDFETIQKHLNERFAEIQKEKALRAKEQPTKPSAPYTGDKP